ncbi:hypothetical protein BH20ACI3_BH20ACI3_28970 [soil metagenome]
MNLSPSSNRRRIIAGVSLIVLAVVFLLNTLTGMMTGVSAPSQATSALAGFTAVVNMVLMIASVLGIMQILRARADWIGLLGATFTLIGQTAASRMGVIIQLYALSESGTAGIPPNLLEILSKSAPLVWASIVPIGIFFPLGLIMLGIALVWARPVNRLFGLLLAIGGVLFPIGRALRMAWAITACDIVLGVAFALIGWQILTRPEIWEKSSPVD